MRRIMRAVTVAAAVGALAATATGPVAAQGGDPARDGRFLTPFAEPTVDGQRTDQTCVTADDGSLDCKPTAGSMAILPTGPDDIVYFNALEGTENVRTSIVAEFGNVAINAQARRLQLNHGDPQWRPTDAVDSGVNREGNGNDYLLPGNVANTTETYNDGSLFCADLNFLADGRVITVGGTSYYQEPGNDVAPQVGVVELEGMRNTRVYDPATNTWGEFDPMNYGRWYPTMVTLADGDQFVASGVEKLLKPVYPNHPQDSGRNVVQTETFDPETGTWTYTGVHGDKSLPLFPRLHLLPNGDVYYNTAGQVFNPFGQSYDEALWSIASAWNPSTGGWTDLGVPGLEELRSMQTAPDRAQEILPPDMAATVQEMLARGQGAGQALLAALQEQDFGPAMQASLGVLAASGLEGIGSVLGAGFRGSTFSVMLPLEPDADGSYTQAQFLTAGGAVAPSPGSYFPIPFSRIDTVDTSAGPNGMDLSTRWTGSLNTARWYSTGVLLPSGEVLALSGSTADEVAGPGSGFPITQAELFDPATETWRTVATQGRERVYHNTAALLPDGRVLVGGHDMISTMYASNFQIPGGFSPDGRDPSFEIYEPPYLHYGVAQPRITNARRLGDLHLGGTLRLDLDVPASQVDSVRLVRNPSITHLVDADQRTVDLPVTSAHGHTVTVQLPSQPAVMPPGPYLLFVNRTSSQGPVPSIAAQLTAPFDGTYAAGVDRSNDTVGERPAADPGFTNEIPPLDEVLPLGPGVPPAGSGGDASAPAAATTDRAATSAPTAESGHATTSATDAATAPSIAPQEPVAGRDPASATADAATDPVAPSRPRGLRPPAASTPPARVDAASAAAPRPAPLGDRGPLVVGALALLLGAAAAQAAAARARWKA